MVQRNAWLEQDSPGTAVAEKLPRPRLAASAWPLTLARDMFGLDYRSLALLRIAIALCFLWVTYCNAWEMRAFYTDEGVLPRGELLDSGPPFSLFLAQGGPTFAALLFGLQFLLGFMLLVGYRTRVAALGGYILLFSMQNRQPVLLFGADIALRVGMFWMIFLPLARRYSIDSLTGRTKAAAGSRPYLGIAGIAFIVQVGLIYAAGAMMKTGDTWRVDHNAVAYALALDVYSRPLGHWLSQFPAATTFFTIFTLYLELYGPLLFVLPVFSKWSRLLAIGLFAGLQIGFGACMVMGIFGGVMIGLTLALLPAMFWERLAEPAGRKAASLARAAGASGLVSMRRAWPAWVERERACNALRAAPPTAVRITWSVLRDLALAGLVAIMCLWNLGNVPGQRWRIPPRLTEATYGIGLNQTWDMFAPNPQSVDGWFVVAGTLNNGRTINLMTGESPVSYDRPASIPASFPSQIWMAYLISYWYDGSADPEAFCNYLGNRWNESHPNDQRLHSVEIIRMMQSIYPGPTKSGVKGESVWIEYF